MFYKVLNKNYYFVFHFSEKCTIIEEEQTYLIDQKEDLCAQEISHPDLF